jgi:hypothetical protein
MRISVMVLWVDVSMACYYVLFNWPHSLGEQTGCHVFKGYFVQTNCSFSYYEDSTEDTFHWHNADACLAGLGTGLLSTVAVSVSPTLADMPVTGAEVVRMAFRLGILVHEVSRNLQAPTSDGGPGDSWAYVVPDAVAADIQSELDAFHDAKVRNSDLFHGPLGVAR